MVDIFEEVTEDLRRDRSLRLWKKYGTHVIVFAALVVIGVAGYQGWKSYRLQEREAAAMRYAAALELARAGRPAEAADSFKLLADETGSEGYGVLARFQEAGQRFQAGDAAGGLAVLDGLAADRSVEPIFRDLATLTAAAQRMGAGGDPGALRERLEALDRPDNPWRYSALELRALLALNGGDDRLGRELLKRLVDDTATPQAMRARAAELLAVVGS